MALEHRIVRYGHEDPRALKEHPLNFRMHPDRQKAVVTGSLSEIGWIDDVLVNLRTGDAWPEGERDVLTVINGHLRRDIAIAENEPTVPCKFVDLSPDEERLALALFDESTALAQRDTERLGELLETLNPTHESLGEFLAGMAEDLQFLGEERPSLDDLEDEYGEYDEESFWPQIKLRVPQETFDLYSELMRKAAGTDAEKFRGILDAAAQT